MMHAYNTFSSKLLTLPLTTLSPNTTGNLLPLHNRWRANNEPQQCPISGLRPRTRARPMRLLCGTYLPRPQKHFSVSTRANLVHHIQRLVVDHANALLGQKAFHSKQLEEREGKCVRCAMYDVWPSDNQVTGRGYLFVRGCAKISPVSGPKPALPLHQGLLQLLLKGVHV